MLPIAEVDRDPLTDGADRKQAIDTALGPALDAVLRPLAKERRPDARRRIVELIDGVIEASKPPAAENPPC